MSDGGDYEGPFYSTPSPRSEVGNPALGFPVVETSVAHEFRQPFGQGAFSHKFVDESHPHPMCAARWCQFGQSCSKPHCQCCHHSDHAPAVESKRRNDQLRKSLKAAHKERDMALQSNAKLENNLRECTMKEAQALQREEQLQHDLHERHSAHERMEAEHYDMVQQLRQHEAELQRNLKAIQKERNAALQCNEELENSLRESAMKEKDALQQEEQLQQDLQKRQCEYERMWPERRDAVQQLRQQEANLQGSFAESETIEKACREHTMKEIEVLQREEQPQQDVHEEAVDYERMEAEHDDVVQQLRLHEAELQRSLMAIRNEHDVALQSNEELESCLTERTMKETESLQREMQLQQDLQKAQGMQQTMEAKHDNMVLQLRPREAELQKTCVELQQELTKMQGAMQIARNFELSLNEAMQTCLRHAQQNHEIQRKDVYDRCVLVEQNLYEELKHKNASLERSEAHVAGLQYSREQDEMRFAESQTENDAKSLHMRRQSTILWVRDVLVSCLSGVASWTCQQAGRSEFPSSLAPGVNLWPAPIETAELCTLTERSIQKAVNDLGDDILQIAAGNAKKGERSLWKLAIRELPHWRPWMDYGTAKKIGGATQYGCRYIAQNQYLQQISDRFARIRLQPEAAVFYEEREYQVPWGGIAVLPADNSGARSMDYGFFRAEVFPGADFESFEWELYMSWSPLHCDYWDGTCKTRKLGDPDSAAGSTFTCPFGRRSILNTESAGADVAAGPSRLCIFDSDF